MILKYNSIEDSEEARSRLEKKLVDHCKVKFRYNQDSERGIYVMSSSRTHAVLTELFGKINRLKTVWRNLSLAEGIAYKHSRELPVHNHCLTQLFTALMFHNS